MYQEFFTGRSILILPIVAMLAFLFTFIAAVLYTFRGAHQKAYAALAVLPLAEEGEPGEPSERKREREPV